MNLKEKIEVMQAALDGKEIEYYTGFRWETLDEPKEVDYDWLNHAYRIKPEPREFYVNFFSDGGEAIYRTKEEATFGTRQYETIKVKEVIE